MPASGVLCAITQNESMGLPEILSVDGAAKAASRRVSTGASPLRTTVAMQPDGRRKLGGCNLPSGKTENTHLVLTRAQARQRR